MQLYNNIISLSNSITNWIPGSSVNIITNPNHGVASLSGQIITYTPSSGYTGSDTITFNATNPGGTSNVATVSITDVLLANLSILNIKENTTTLFSMSNLTSFSPANLAIPTTQGGLVILSPLGLSYKPPVNFTGTDTFIFNIVSGNLISNTSTLTFVVA